MIRNDGGNLLALELLIFPVWTEIFTVVYLVFAEMIHVGGVATTPKTEGTEDP